MTGQYNTNHIVGRKSEGPKPSPAFSWLQLSSGVKALAGKVYLICRSPAAQPNYRCEAAADPFLTANDYGDAGAAITASALKLRRQAVWARVIKQQEMKSGYRYWLPICLLQLALVAGGAGGSGHDFVGFPTFPAVVDHAAIT